MARASAIMIATMPSILFDDIIRFGFDGVGDYRNESRLSAWARYRTAQDTEEIWL